MKNISRETIKTAIMIKDIDKTDQMSEMVAQAGVDNNNTKSNQITDRAKKYLSLKENYPCEHGEMWYIDYSGWNVCKTAHPCELTSWIVDDVFSNGNLFGSLLYEKGSTDGWLQIALVQRTVLYNFIKDNLSITEKQVDKLLFDHGIKLIPSPHGNPAKKWISSVRFGQVIDHYAVSLVDEEKERIIRKIAIIIKETGHRLEDFIL